MAKMPKGQFGRKALPWNPLPHMQEYLDELEAAGRSLDYIKAIRKSLAHFSILCQQEDVKHPQEIERKHLLRYQIYVNSKAELSRSYKVNLLRYLKGWLKWMHQQGHLQSNPWQDIVIGAYKKDPRPISDESLERMFQAHNASRTSMSPFLWHREEVVLVLLYSWGLRIHELNALNVSNLDPRLDFVTAINKGGGTKSLPYPQELKMVVQRYLKVRAPYCRVGEDALVINPRGERLSIDATRAIISDLGRRAGVAVNPHRLRDTFGTNMLDEDMPVERLAKIMGHTNTKQTLAYARVNDKKVAEDHARAITNRLNGLLDVQWTGNLTGGHSGTVQERTGRTGEASRTGRTPRRTRPDDGSGPPSVP